MKQEDEREEYNMCQALQEWMEEERNEGIELGIERGIEQGIRVFVLDNLEERVPQDRILEKLQRRFSLEREQAQGYYDKFLKEYAISN